jgi:hypothetical protein
MMKCLTQPSMARAEARKPASGQEMPNQTHKRYYIDTTAYDCGLAYFELRSTSMIDSIIASLRI